MKDRTARAIFVIRDHSGYVIGAAQHFVTNVCIAEDAKARAAVAALLFAKYLGISGTIFKGDAWRVVKTISSRQQTLSDIRNLVEEARHHCRGFMMRQVKNVKCEANHAAHTLAKQDLVSK